MEYDQLVMNLNLSNKLRHEHEEALDIRSKDLKLLTTKYEDLLRKCNEFQKDNDKL